MARLARESSMEDESSHGDQASGSGCRAERPISLVNDPCPILDRARCAAEACGICHSDMFA
jgi:hypothetical protein